MTESDHLTIGFLGCGLIARSHARGLANTANASIGPVFDVDTDRASSFAVETGGHAVETIDAVIDRSDAVYVCTWTSEHLPLVERVVAAGRAVFCEKPLSTDLATAQQLHDAVASAGVINQVGLVLRHSPAFRYLQHAIAGHELMNIVFRDDQYIPVQGMYGSTWRGDASLAGAGTLLEHSIHDLDLLEWMMGPITSVSARIGYSHGIDHIDDSATVTLVNQAGAQAVLTSVWHDVLSRPSQRRVEVFCRDQVLSLTGDWHGPVITETSDATSTLEGATLSQTANETDDRGTNPDAAFVDAVLNNDPAYPDTAIALRAHVLADAAYRSAADGGTPQDV